MVYVHVGSVDGVVCHRNLAALDSVDAIRFTGKDNKNISGAAHAGKVAVILLSHLFTFCCGGIFMRIHAIL